MEKNVGGYDRIARLVVGPVLILLGLASYLGVVLPPADTPAYALVGLVLLVGVVFVVTGATRVCFLNRILAVNTFEGKADTSVPESGRSDRT